MVKPILSENTFKFFQLLSTIKVNHVAKIMQSVYLRVIFQVIKAQKNYHSRRLKRVATGFLKTETTWPRRQLRRVVRALDL